jgi:hypothetical protein
MKKTILTIVVAATLSISSVSFAKDKIKIEKAKFYSAQQDERQEGLEQEREFQAQ